MDKTLFKVFREIESNEHSPEVAHCLVHYFNTKILTPTVFLTLGYKLETGYKT